MATDYRSIILAESSRFIGQIGNSIVLNLYARIQEIEALARALATTAENLPKTDEIVHQLIPNLLNYQGDLSIAGGGIWPEPFSFHPDREHYSFFWGRDASGHLVFFDDYNRSAAGYYHETWYVVGRYARPGQCIWSASYLDPHSRELIVSCTTPMTSQGAFAGVVTVDLKIEGFQKAIATWQDKTGGYVFLVDQRNQFIAFPGCAKCSLLSEGSAFRFEKTWINTAEFALRQPLFGPVAIALDQLNQQLLQQQGAALEYAPAIAKALQDDSPHMTATDAELIAAIMTHSTGTITQTTYLAKQFEIDNDAFLHEASTVFLFQVPDTYWKVGIVKPFSEAATATYSMIQAEKMSSLGQMVAGMAHEINNPINFIHGNLNYANQYVKDLIALITLYQQHYPTPDAEIQRHIDAVDLEFLVSDLQKLLGSMRVGADRIRQIVVSLRNFSRLDESDIKTIDIHEGLESTLLLLESRFRPKANHPGVKVIREYGELPTVECQAGPLNQVFMNLLINALDAMDEALVETQAEDAAVSTALIGTGAATRGRSPASPKIRIKTECLDNQRILIRIADNGPGIPESAQQRLFDPFFTTKPLGKGTGLGLSICRQIITEQHHGKLWFVSSPQQGTEFFIEIPVYHSKPHPTSI